MRAELSPPLTLRIELPPQLISSFADARVATGLTICLTNSGGIYFHNENIDDKPKK